MLQGIGGNYKYSSIIIMTVHFVGIKYISSG